MQWKIVVDSSCDLLNLKSSIDDVSYTRVPFTIHIDDHEYVDTKDLDLNQMIEHMENTKSASSTSCPSPDTWLQAFREADNVIAITISSQLSGSFNSALVAKEMALEENPDKKIYILDTKSTGPKLILAVYKSLELIGTKLSFEHIVENLQSYMSEVGTLFTLSSFGNLIKNGRMNKLSGTLANVLKIRIIGMGSEEGKLEVFQKSRGERHVISAIVDKMEKLLYKGNNVVISHCKNIALADKLKQEINAKWPQSKIEIFPTSGLDSYYAETNGVIIAFDK
jgi:DegV family protein with EDD domain